ncbi:hypothetical protein ACJZL1_01090 [Wolbachia endosymbiont of Rhagoletis indifferens]|nr:hypothetical protein [Wolbachia endosymbiont (group A) of Bibio marci]
MVNQRLQIVHFQLREAINDRAYIRIPDILTEVSGDELLQVLTRQDINI